MTQGLRIGATVVRSINAPFHDDSPVARRNAPPIPRGAPHPLNLMSRIASDLRLMLRRPEKLQFAALCYRWTEKRKDIEILVITSRDTGRWVIPKGWPMERRTAREVAEREAFEEAGVIGTATEASIGTYDYLKGLNGGIKVPCKVQVHALEVKKMAKDFKEKGMRRLEWVSCEEAALRVDEQALKELILSFQTSMKAAAPRKASRG